MSRRRRPAGSAPPPPELLTPPADGYPIPDGVDPAVALLNWRARYGAWVEARAAWVAAGNAWPSGDDQRALEEAMCTPDEPWSPI